MKKLLYFFAAVAVCSSLVSCESFLDTNNYWSKTSDNFPANEADADQMLIGIYNNLNVAIGNAPGNNHHLWAIAASDDCLGGGGSNDPDFQAHDLLLNAGADFYNSFYCDRYTGVARANVAIESFPNCGLPEEKLNQYLGEAYFLRAFFYYELASMFGNIPCPVTSTADATQAQISGEPLWGQILQDAQTAAKLLPAVKAAGDGHADRYAAQALLGRAYLFYSGFYNDEDVTLPNGETLTKADVAAAIKDCVDNSGYSLVDDYHNLWPYSNEVTVNDPESPWKDKGYKYVGSGTNPEAMFMVKFNTQPDWGTTIGYSNQYALFMGIRAQGDIANHFPFGEGWGMCPVSPAFVDEWTKAEPNDQRRDASIIKTDVWSDYKFGMDNYVQETGIFQTKTQPVSGRDANGDLYCTYYSVLYPNLSWNDDTNEDYALCTLDDLVIIRFAEVLLMDAELNNNQASFDAVRKRAGLASKPISVENIRNERRWELAFEGVRFNDMRRYGEDYAVAALNKQEGVKIWNIGVEGKNTASKYNGSYGARYKETKGFVPLPSSQIALSAGSGAEYKFEQNPGWGIAAAEFGGWQ